MRFCNPLGLKTESGSMKVEESNLESRQNAQSPRSLIPRVEMRQATRVFNEGPARPEQECPEPGSLTIDTSTREAAWAAASRPTFIWPRGGASACRIALQN